MGNTKSALPLSVRRTRFARGISLCRSLLLRRGSHSCRFVCHFEFRTGNKILDIVVNRRCQWSWAVSRCASYGSGQHQQRNYAQEFAERGRSRIHSDACCDGIEDAAWAIVFRIPYSDFRIRKTSASNKKSFCSQRLSSVLHITCIARLRRQRQKASSPPTPAVGWP